MLDKTISVLEFDKIINKLCDIAISDKTKQKLLTLRPFLSISEVNLRIKETTEARKILESMGTPPLPAMKDMEKILDMTEKGSMLLPEQLSLVGQFIAANNRMKNYLKKAESLGVDMAYYGNSLVDLSGLLNEINVCIRGNRVDDAASKDLKDIRRKMESVNSEIRSKLENLLRSKKDWFTESFVSNRNGHFVLPVKKEYKNQVNGSTLDISSTGATYFIVPNTVLNLEDELSLLRIREENEERKILYTLTNLVQDNSPSIHLNMEALETLDFIFAKGKLSMDMNGVPAVMNNKRYIHIINGRHPFIKPSDCVPLNFTIGNEIRGVVITGPNTGGKTVALKTVGLLQLMAQSGLHIPCESAELCMNNIILCDIGDGQSITENLSTFSAHITNIIEILSQTDRESLVLLDELGSGTDPAEGMGIAISILEELKEKGCLFIATTHYPEVKDYADNTAGLINAKMAFDRDSLKPLYRLEIGMAGESCALYIAKRLGLPKRMLTRAYEEAYGRSNEVKNGTIPDSAFIMDASEETNYVMQNHIQKEKSEKPVNVRSLRFHIGDSVMVYPQKKIGIVYKTANEKGEIGVQIQKTKQLVNHKRLQLKAPATELYPVDYDFSIIFDTVENRKARHKMEKGYQPDLKITYEKEDM
ncbi:DNA mismatch repair protein MutS [Anaerocolumna sedimenticola]|uniref:DNA mismatch repair protein MutS n=1 Tax=Anaerocolumna sedimenticola TaxID=2696063 RepID=A0A6P1TKA7_9FIRM|nr:DNA mismatch repair protein MutS [Anaerocolumna sedimenticola]QHQ60542.1 DNA mismatch repair protein MutS [Anaerocolumna sedimenticola]